MPEFLDKQAQLSIEDANETRLVASMRWVVETCKVGAKAVGCCAHVASVHWYLEYRRDNHTQTKTPSLGYADTLQSFATGCSSNNSASENNLVALHFKYDQARRRFVEWAQNEIAVVPDFHKRILFSDEAHFWLNGYVNKQNCRIWSEANPQVYVETPLHPEKLTVWGALWAGGILLQKR
ncbi:hypothetical protein TNCV_3315461 [Trichonephila clavipes]|nr:hypothetical protein TNCV_3315461 [Trichonephila clavipes]